VLPSVGFERERGTGAANAAYTFNSADYDSRKRRLCYVYIRYSAAPTQAGTTVTLISGMGSAFDLLLSTGSANTQNNLYLPDGQLALLPGDQIQVAAPAGGVGITASVVVVTELLN
jgi:hypothetical protein